jgi:hypothetical protein
MLHFVLVGRIFSEQVPEMIRNKEFKIEYPLKHTKKDGSQKVAVFKSVLLPEGVWKIDHKVETRPEENVPKLITTWVAPDFEPHVWFGSGEYSYWVETLHNMRGELTRGGELPMVDFFEVVPSDEDDS